MPVSKDLCRKLLLSVFALCVATGVALGQSVPVDDPPFRMHNPAGSFPGDSIPSTECSSGQFQVFEDDFVRFDTNAPYVVKFPVLGVSGAGTTTYQPSVVVQWSAAGVSLIDRWNAGVWVDTNAFETEIGGFPAVVSQVFFSASSWTKPAPPGPSYNLNFSLTTTVVIDVGPETRVTLGWGCTNVAFARPTGNSQVGLIPLGRAIPNRVRRNALMQEMADMFHHVMVRPR